MADLNHERTHEPARDDPSTPSEPATDARRRRARREQLPQDDVPHNAVARTTPERCRRRLEHARVCARIADDNRAKDILLLDLRKATPLVDFFVIATATSRRQSHAIADEIDQEMKKRGELKLGHRRVRGRPLDPDRLRRLRRPRLLGRGPAPTTRSKRSGATPRSSTGKTRPASDPPAPTPSDDATPSEAISTPRTEHP